MLILLLSFFIPSLLLSFFSSPPVPPCCVLLLLQFTLVTVGAVNPFAVFSLEKEGERKEGMMEGLMTESTSVTTDGKMCLNLKSSNICVTF